MVCCVPLPLVMTSPICSGEPRGRRKERIKRRGGGGGGGGRGGLCATNLGDEFSDLQQVTGWHVSLVTCLVMGTCLLSEKRLMHSDSNKKKQMQCSTTKGQWGRTWGRGR